VTVPPNTQILELSFTADDATTAQQMSAAIAKAYLDNRARRFDEVNAGRLGEVEKQTSRVITDLRSATAASHRGTDAARSFQSQLATALRNELVSLRAQRTALETSATPAGSVISPATTPTPHTSLAGTAAPVGGALVGLLLGYSVAAAMERHRRVVRSPAEVEAAGLRIAAAVPPSRRGAGLSRRADPTGLDSAIRRLRSAVLAADPRPAAVAVAAATAGEGAAEVSELLSASFARAGHRAVVVRTSSQVASGGLAVEEGLAEVLVHERLSALEVLQPTVEPLLCVLPAGRTVGQAGDLLVTDRVRAVLDSLEGAGNVVVVESPGLDTPEGEAVTGAATLAVVVVRLGRTRRSALAEMAEQATRLRVPFVALVLNRGDALSLPELAPVDEQAAPGAAGGPVPRRRLARSRR
jgi:Mrp family chromosome partitioning ATPase